MEINCLQCKKCFKTYPCRVREGVGKFCSKKCFNSTRLNTIEKRFWNKVKKKSGCWEWLGFVDAFGYGKLRLSSNKNSQNTGAHRISYLIHYGAIPAGMLVCHKCDNPPCVNPKHLFLGTYKDNTQDMITKGRYRSKRDKLSGQFRRVECKHGEDETERDN